MSNQLIFTQPGTAAAPAAGNYPDPANQSAPFVVGDEQTDTLDWRGQPPGKLFFLPDLRAFRAGGVSRDTWNRPAIGAYSWAGGCNTQASGEGSVALGFGSVASGMYTVALGTENEVSGDLAVAVGGFNQASGAGSFAAGASNAATGEFAATFGRGTVAASYAEFVVGSYNTAAPEASADRPRPTDRALVVGTGTDRTNPRDGFVVYKDGSLGLSAPAQAPADPTNRVYAFDGKLHFNGQALATASHPEEAKNTLPWEFDSPRNTMVLPTAARRGANVEVPLTAEGGFVDSRLLLCNQPQALRFGIFNETDKSRPMGKHSVGLGNYATASGEASFAVGYQPTASGAHATALGFKAVAQGRHAFATGASADREPVGSCAYGDASVALSGGRADGEHALAWARGNAVGEHAVAAGYGSQATGDCSVAIGRFATAPSYGEVVVGTNNTDYKPSNSKAVAENDRAFCIGVGGASKKDALVVFKNGRMLLNNTEPATGQFSVVKGLKPAQLQINAELDGVTILNNPFSNSLNIVKASSWPEIDSRFISFGYQGETSGNYVEVGSIRASGNNSVRFYDSSDARLKNDSGLLTDGLATLSRIKIHHFTWKDTGAADAGVFAQELYEVFPAAVKKGDDGSDVQQRWMVDYAKMQPLTIAAVQELHRTVTRQQEQIDELRQQVATLLQR